MATQSSTDSDASVDVSQSMTSIREQMDVLAHATRHLYAGAVRVAQSVEHPELDIWSKPFKLHERARLWAKRNMVASVSSLWQVHETLVECAKRENRVQRGGKVQLSRWESEILGLPADEPVPIWQVLGNLPRFFV